MRTATIICFCFTLLFSACTTAPKPANYPYSSEEKMKSVHHWEVLAKKVVETQVLPSLSTDASRSVYVDNSDPTDFGKAFHTYLVTELFNRGVTLSKTPQDANVLKWGTQLVWNDKGCNWMPGVIGGAVELTAFLLAGSSVMTLPSDVELIITTQVDRGDDTLSRKTYNYYINVSDKWNFRVPDDRT